MPRSSLLPLVMAATTACGTAPQGPPDDPPAGPVAVRLERVAGGLGSPIYVTAPPGDPRLFVVDQGGRIRILRNGTVLPTPFLDVSALITAGGEQGLLGMAFSPTYATDGRVFVSYTDRAGDSRIVRYRVSADPDLADPATATDILLLDQPFGNHNGGWIGFGPDGFLYAGFGDGGGAGDPLRAGRDRGTLLGKLLRLDVRGTGGAYTVPPTNPFVGTPGARGEIWALGLRNPWRISFDRATGDLYIADVGQDEREEVNAVPAASGGAGRGLDFGWNTMEGTRCYAAASCDRAGLTLPVAEYTHAEGCSVTGGYAYRGAAIPGLRGTYFYADFCSRFIRSFRLRGGAATDPVTWSGLTLDGAPTSFGEDGAGELHITTSTGTVFRLAPG